MPANPGTKPPTRLVIATAAIAVWAVAATVLLLATDPLDVKNVGSLAEWATAGVTLLALVAAGWAGVSASGQLAVMRRDAAARDVDAKERQARLVFPVHSRARADDGTRLHIVTVENRSDQPITNVDVLLVGPANANAVHMRDVPPGTSIADPLGAVIGQLISDAVGVQRSDLDFLHNAIEFDFPMVFTDHRGARWHRLPDGELIERDPAFTTIDAQMHAMKTSRFGHSTPAASKPRSAPASDL